ncbi:MAG: coproporphyrinogen III oxidase, partial [Fusobacteriia bacterium 4572_74]
MGNIKLNFEIKKNNLKEFIRVLIPELVDEKITIMERRCDEFLELELEAVGKKIIFLYENHLDKLEDQRIVMSKVGLLKLMDKKYPWGGLIGVRPTKLVRRFLNLSYTYEEIEKILCELYLVTPKKVKLLIDVVKKEMVFLNRDHINMYIGIPYCPTKCRYCSFASYEMKGKIGEYYNEFVETLLEEISLTGKFLKGTSNKIESLYIGGGTPSILTEDDMERVLKSIKDNINLTDMREFTLEAGRVDTLTFKKLDIMKFYGVERISLNPQTFNLKTLEKMNRPLDRDKFDRMFEYAKKIGLIINMDLILGLPGETTEDILYTLEELKKYPAENLTTHVLALKKASVLFKDIQTSMTLDYEKIEKKLYEVTEDKKMKPYYMYRQKNSLKWGENMGFAIEGTESIFNIEMIEENQSTLGLGGGAITKSIVAESLTVDKIKRIVSPKEP